jgi:virginiamycin B lyase
MWLALPAFSRPNLADGEHRQRRLTQMHKLPTLAIACVLGQASLSAAAQELPDGPGKQIVATACGTCHDVNRIRIGYTAEGWRTVIRMMQNVEAPVEPNKWATVTDYLIRSFPERPRRTAVVALGSLEVAIREWAVPTPGSRPHDPLATRDGAIWWTGQLANKLGRLDPKTGQMKEYPLRSPRTGPHGLVEDRAGNIGFTGNTAGLIGKLDPSTGAVTEYNLPNPDGG